MNLIQESARLRTRVANRILQHMLHKLDETDIEPELLCKLTHSFCELRKQDVAAEKNATALEVARIKAEAKPTKRQTDTEDEEAPYGRKPDGTPHTHAEFLETLDEALKDIYGFSLNDKPKPSPYLHTIPPGEPTPPDYPKRTTAPDPAHPNTPPEIRAAPVRKRSGIEGKRPPELARRLPRTRSSIPWSTNDDSESECQPLPHGHGSEHPRQPYPILIHGPAGKYPHRPPPANQSRARHEAVSHRR